MYWNPNCFVIDIHILPINRNMWCIETAIIWIIFRIFKWLIETWDVLKPPTVNDVGGVDERLIETWDVLKLVKHLHCKPFWKWLIETWDVLKHIKRHVLVGGFSGLIETWDVLKLMIWCLNGQEKRINRNMGCIETLYWVMYLYVHFRINRNMGCIETFFNVFALVLLVRLIETWDVLKRGYLVTNRIRIMINRNMGCIETNLQ